MKWLKYWKISFNFYAINVEELKLKKIVVFLFIIAIQKFLNASSNIELNLEKLFNKEEYFISYFLRKDMTLLLVIVKEW